MSPLRTGDTIIPVSAPIVEQKVSLEKLLAELSTGTRRQPDVIFDKDQAILTIGENALFFPDTHHLKPNAGELLRKLGNFIKKGKYPVEIIGHTDNRAAEEKGYQSNWELSSLMAVTVQKYFVEISKVVAERLSAYGYAGQRAISANDTIESRKINRRIEMILHFGVPVYIKKLYSQPPEGIFTYKRFNFKIY